MKNTQDKGMKEQIDTLVRDFSQVGKPSKSEIRRRLELLYRDVLEAYSRFLEKNGYMDSDWYAEEPNAIESFIKSHNQYDQSKHK